MIAFENRSSLVSDAEVARIARACAIQIARDVAPAWGIAAVQVKLFAPGRSPQSAWPIYIVDDADQTGFLAWHSSDDRGRPYGRVFVKAIRQARASLSATCSHEAIEALVDPHVDQWRGGYAVEIGDPVENDTYTIAWRTQDDEGAVVRVAVSDFVTPAWFDRNNTAGPYDHLGRAVGPFRLRPGGYAVTSSGTRFGASYPEWRKWTKIADGSRTLRLIPADELAALGRV